ncbi:MAG: hypothetical protein ACE145_14930 [Terriglobia bacterium]
MQTAPRRMTPTCFGDYEVDFEAGELRKNGLRIKLQYQPFRILALFWSVPAAW